MFRSSFINNCVIFASFFTFLTIAPSFLKAQKCTFLNTSHDFGEVISTMVPPAAFAFVNTGQKPLAILRVKASYETKASFERKYVQPGDTGYIYLTYQSPRLGQFSDKIEVYSNAGTEAAHLEIKGKNISIVDCYPNKSNHSIRLIQVINKITKAPIDDAELVFRNFNGETIKTHSEKQGKVTEEIPIGQYDISIQKKGFEPLQTTLYINKSKPLLYFELMPLRPSNDIVEKDNSAPSSEPIKYDSKALGAGFSANNLCFLIDVSLSMKQYRRMDKLKKAMDTLIQELRKIDYVSIISYNNATKILTTSVEGTLKDSLQSVIAKLTPKGLTNGVKGLQKAYELTENRFIVNGNNQILLATDGEFTGKGQSEKDIKNLIKQYADKGIKMSVFDFGKEVDASARLERIAAFAGGSYVHFESNSTDYSLIINEIKKQSMKNQ